ncbi:MAG: tripartite tricarboxylate transporter substrate binding protein [Hyphomicrobiales bacterium]|nr:tripartite tricarboxylate transporter substrate binding protein [Hyphomicrobiales bacterium]
MTSAALTMASVGHAQEKVAASTYPMRPIRGIVPYQPGGPTDVMARLLAARLGESLGQQVIIDNRGGASGVIAAVMAKQAPADGYTLFFGTITALTTLPALSNKLPYDPLRDFAPITLTSSNPYIIAVHPSTANSFADFVERVRARPGQITYGSAGTGGGAHLAAELLRITAKLDMIHVPYQGSGPALTDLIAGQIQMSYAGPISLGVHARTGRVKAIAVTSRKRLASWPDLPTVAEHGYPEYEATSWQGVEAPAGTPAAIVDRLHAAIVKALASAELQQRFALEGAEMGGMPPAEFTRFIRAEAAKWKRVVRESNIRVE